MKLRILAFFLLICSASFAADIMQLTQENFDQVLSQSTKPVIVDVNATWCGPCRMMEPVIEDLSAEYGDSVQFAKIDFDSQTKLVKRYGVSNLPTILFFKPGQTTVSVKSVGFVSKEDFEAKIDKFLKK